MKNAMHVAEVTGDDAGVAQYAQQAMYFTLWVRLNTSASQCTSHTMGWSYPWQFCWLFGQTSHVSFSMCNRTAHAVMLQINGAFH